MLLNLPAACASACRVFGGAPEAERVVRGVARHVLTRVLPPLLRAPYASKLRGWVVQDDIDIVDARYVLGGWGLASGTRRCARMWAAYQRTRTRPASLKDVCRRALVPSSGWRYALGTLLRNAAPTAEVYAYYAGVAWANAVAAAAVVVRGVTHEAWCEALWRGDSGWVRSFEGGGR